MACRRQDRRNLTSCNIGDVGKRGCSRGCCPYLDSEIFEETHDILSTSPYFSPHQPYIRDETNEPGAIDEFAARGRTDLRWRTCGSLHHRPKFICVNPQCDFRRSFKPFVDEDRFEYSITRWGWRVRPLASENEVLKMALKRYGLCSFPREERERGQELIRRLDESEREDGGAWGRGLELWKRIEDYQKEESKNAENGRSEERDGSASQPRRQRQQRRRSDSSASSATDDSTIILTPSSSTILTPTSTIIFTPEPSTNNDDDPPTQPAQPLTITELIDIMSREPELWWQDITRHGNQHCKRCPQCSSPGKLIGSNFRVPAKTDDRAWQEILALAADGVDLNANFVYCPTIDEYNELILEANRVRRLKGNEEAWKEEKTKRIQNLTGRSLEKV